MRSVLLIFAFYAVLISCQSKGKEHANHNVYYTCSMHPQVVSDKMGTCPICHMDLVKVKKQNNLNPGEIYLNEEQILLGNIKTDTLIKGFLNDKLLLTGVLTYNQNSKTTVSSRIMGRVDKLYHKSIGDYITAGSPLYEIYSEELNNAKQEYVLAIDKKKYLKSTQINIDDLIAAASNKLQLWGLSLKQIQELEKSNKISNTTTFYSPASGYLTSIITLEGNYVMDGGNIIEIADLSTLWIEAQVYSSQLSLIQKNTTVSALIPDLNNLELNAKNEFMNPELNSNSRINILRFTVFNIGQKLKPGMPVYVRLNSPSISSVSLPIDAVIRDSRGATVWLQTGKNTFKSIMVEVGLESDNRIEIKRGLNPKDIVVTSGAYLLNSEFVFKNGADPMAGMKM